MATRSSKLLGGLCFALVTVLAACGGDDDDNATPSATGGSSGSSGSSGTAGSSGSGGTAGTAGSAGTAGTGGTAGTAGTAGSSGSAGSAGSIPTDATCPPTGTPAQGTCFSGTPSANTDFLNCCTNAQCTKYDNSQLSKLVNGQLPALP